MFQPDIDVIRAVHSDRIRRDVIARMRVEPASRKPVVLVARRSIGRSIERLGVRIAGEHGVDPTFRLAR